MSTVLTKNGVEMAVLRPKDPRKAIKLAKAARGTESFQAILASQEYTLVGLAHVKGKKLLDPKTNRIIGDIRAGDSFVSWDALKAQYAATQGAIDSAVKAIEARPAAPVVRPNGRPQGDLEGMCPHECYDTELCAECDGGRDMALARQPEPRSGNSER